MIGLRVARWTGLTPRHGPGTYTAQYEPVAVDGEIVVATGTSSYRERLDGPIVRVYHNSFEMRFDAEGRCQEFTEYYIRAPETSL